MSLVGADIVRVWVGCGLWVPMQSTKNNRNFKGISTVEEGMRAGKGIHGSRLRG